MEISSIWLFAFFSVTASCVMPILYACVCAYVVILRLFVFCVLFNGNFRSVFRQYQEKPLAHCSALFLFNHATFRSTDLHQASYWYDMMMIMWGSFFLILTDSWVAPFSNAPVLFMERWDSFMIFGRSVIRTFIYTVVFHSTCKTKVPEFTFSTVPSPNR